MDGVGGWREEVTSLGVPVSQWEKPHRGHKKERATGPCDQREVMEFSWQRIFPAFVSMHFLRPGPDPLTQKLEVQPSDLGDGLKHTLKVEDPWFTGRRRR